MWTQWECSSTEGWGTGGEDPYWMNDSDILIAATAFDWPQGENYVIGEL